MEGPGTARVKVLNAAGQFVSENSASFGAGAAVLPLDISGFAQGIYYYQVEISYADGSSKSLPLKTFVAVRP